MSFHDVLNKMGENYLWFILLILILNIQQRRHMPRAARKRMATLYIAVLALVFDIFLSLILTRGWPEWLVFPGFAAVVAIGVVFRKQCWPFRLRCPRCGARLGWKEILVSDGNLCDACYAAEHPEEAPQDAAPPVPAIPSSVDAIDWDNWEASQNCVVVYLFRQGPGGEKEVLLIDKKTGLGKGLVNAPGGHIEPEETAVEAAVREYKEETGLDIEAPREVGRLHFQFLDGTTLRGIVYFCDAWSGALRETDEARGFWCPVKAIPYPRMWEDDRYWLPFALDEAGAFAVHSVFDGERMLSFRFSRKEKA